MHLVPRPGNDLAEWFPLVQATGTPTPATIIVPVHDDLTEILDGVTGPNWEADLAAVRAAADQIGYPAFLRTGHLSAKHSWSHSCHLRDRAGLAAAVGELVEAQACAWLPPARHIVVRELLNADPVFFAFEGMPVTRERRYFARDGVVYDHHPYWPAGAVHTPRDNGAATHTTGPDQWPGRELDATEWLPLLLSISDEPTDEVDTLAMLTETAAEHLIGDWSLDWLWTVDRGWVFIDAAHGEESYRMDANERSVLRGEAPFTPPSRHPGGFLAALMGELQTEESEA